MAALFYLERSSCNSRVLTEVRKKLGLFIYLFVFAANMNKGFRSP